MIPHTGVTLEIVENIDSHDTRTPIDIVKAINGIALDRVINSTDTSHKTQANTETTRAIVMTAHDHRVFCA